MTGFFCSSPVYEFEGWTFEYSQAVDPWPLKKDGEPRKRAGDVFWAVFSRFAALSDKEKTKHRVGGGCERF